MTSIKKIYLAGPDVFRNEPEKYFHQLKILSEKYSIEALSPFDGTLVSSSAKDIFVANIKIMNNVNAVFANITPFRGPGIDDGTAFELGYAFAKGLGLYGYSQFFSFPYLEIAKNFSQNMNSEFPVIESFGHPCNLMIAEAILMNGGRIFASFEECLSDYFSSSS